MEKVPVKEKEEEEEEEEEEYKNRIHSDLLKPTVSHVSVLNSYISKPSRQQSEPR